MSDTVATVIALSSMIYFVYWWGESLPRSSVWNVGLKYLIRGVSLGLVLPLISYVTRIQKFIDNPAANVDILRGIISTSYSVYFWVFIIVLFFLVLSFTFDMLQMRRPDA